MIETTLLAAIGTGSVPTEGMYDWSPVLWFLYGVLVGISTTLAYVKRDS